MFPQLAILGVVGIITKKGMLITFAVTIDHENKSLLFELLKGRLPHRNGETNVAEKNITKLGVEEQVTRFIPGSAGPSGLIKSSVPSAVRGKVTTFAKRFRKRSWRIVTTKE